jgi:hypothetical protein
MKGAVRDEQQNFPALRDRGTRRVERSLCGLVQRGGHEDQGGHNVLFGILDQSHLHGVFARIQDLGPEIVSLAKILEDEQSLLSEEEVWKK